MPVWWDFAGALRVGRVGCWDEEEEGRDGGAEPEADGGGGGSWSLEAAGGGGRGALVAAATGRAVTGRGAAVTIFNDCEVVKGVCWTE